VTPHHQPPIVLSAAQARHLLATLDLVDDFFYHTRHRRSVRTAVGRFTASRGWDADTAVARFSAQVTTAADPIRHALGLFPTTLRATLGVLTTPEETR
jgi:hypothetical protein